MPEPTHFRVRNWDRFQHYKDRSPPWIKLHFEMLASEDWVMLDDASKLLAIVCMLAASRHDGLVPNNPMYLKRMAYLDATPDIGPLISCGFLEPAQAPASVVQARASNAKADARPEESRDRAEESSVEGINVSGYGTSRAGGRGRKPNGYAHARTGGEA